IPALRDINLHKELAGPFLYYVPEVKVLGGSIGMGAIVPFGNQCGHLFVGQPNDCNFAVGDPYAEIDWARYFGTPRPSRHAGALPIPQGLAVLVGFGVVFPAGQFDSSTPLDQAISIGTNIWDFAPSIAVTYTTRPIIGEGTEFSGKFFWNNYLKNQETDYDTGDLLDFEFAVSEHFGRYQVGVAGFYAWQTEDDMRFGVPIPPDGFRAQVLQVGPVLAIDIPEHGSFVKLKATTTVFVRNTVEAWGVAGTWVKRF
ncbi:MAG: transporter, partial [Hyphomicrobiales bacterium]